MPRRGPASGFTLIELMAVVVIMGLALSLVVPNLSATRASQLEDTSRSIADRIQLARERAIVTGVPHRLWIDLEEGEYRVEWFASEDQATNAFDPECVGSDSGNCGTPITAFEGVEEEISLSAPPKAKRDYYPIPSQLGRSSWLSEEHYFVGLQTPDGWFEKGTVQLIFERDGTTEYSELFLADGSDNEMMLEIRALLTQVRIHREGRR